MAQLSPKGANDVQTYESGRENVALEQEQTHRAETATIIEVDDASEAAAEVVVFPAY